MQSHWHAYFTFSKNERIALVVFILLMGAFIAAPYWYQKIMPVSAEEKNLRYQLIQFAQDSVEAEVAESGFGTSANETNRPPIILQAFDPNLVKEADWIAMGIPPKTARIIRRYVTKGGRFIQPDDLTKIWGIRESDCKRLMPYMRIASTVTTHPPAQSNQQERALYKAIEVNTADSAAWASLPGIGKVLSKRIIHYRQRLGGFRSIEELRKVYGLADTVYMKLLPYLRIQPTEKEKPNLNEVTAAQLANRAGIDRDIAEAIVVFRQQNGPFTNFNTLRQLVFVNDSLLAILKNRVLIQ